MSIRVLLADDQPLVRAGFAVFVDAADDMTVVGEAADGRRAVELARTQRADVVVMDIRMPGLDGLAATRLITADPDLAGVRVLVLTTFDVDEYVFEALRAGASGFLGKRSEIPELLDAIRVVHRGDQLLSPGATRALIARFLAQPQAGPADAGALDVLTDREREVLVLVAGGLSNEDIADRLVVSPHTVKTHVNRTMTKLGAHDRAQLVVRAYEAGLVRAAQTPAAAQTQPAPKNASIGRRASSNRAGPS
jgi:DNA-binding NarL/FixJ family response regulator